MKKEITRAKPPSRKGILFAAWRLCAQKKNPPRGTSRFFSRGITLLSEEPEAQVFRFEIDLSTKKDFHLSRIGTHYFLTCFYTMKDELIFYHPNEQDDPIEVVFDEKRETI